MEDGIPEWLHYCHEACCKKGGLVWLGDNITAGI